MSKSDLVTIRIIARGHAVRVAAFRDNDPVRMVEHVRSLARLNYAGFRDDAFNRRTRI